jgi:hypothetical protein
MAWFSRDALHWGALTVVMLITNVTSTVSGMAVDSLMAHSTADERAAGRLVPGRQPGRRRAGRWPGPVAGAGLAGLGAGLGLGDGRAVRAELRAAADPAGAGQDPA